MQQKYDIVIIGSGLGGLTCGYILSKNGYKVAVLEQNSQLGGCLQTFTRKGVKFETGMHYIGSMQEGQALNRYFKYLSLFPNVKVSQLDPAGFDVISLNGEQYAYASGYENFIETLAKKFPSEHQNIKRYVDGIVDVAYSSPFYSLKNFDENRTQIALKVANHETTSINEYIASITSNEELQNVLVGTLPLYAGLKNKTPLYIHSLINESNITGAYRIMGGSDQIATSLVESIRSFGGDVFPSNKVVKINCDNTKAVSVTLENGEQIEANYIVSNAHPETTINMVDSNLIRQVYRDRISHIEHSVSNFTVYLRFKENKVPYMNHNYYYYKGKDVWGGENYTSQEWPKSFLYVHLCPKEPSEYAQAAELIVYMRFDETLKWLGTKIGRRGEEYEAFKRQKAEKLLSLLEKEFPGTLTNVESYYTSSPLTYLDYTGTKEGSMYGMLRDKNDPVSSRVSHRTKIPNLLMTGQNINAHGIMGVIIGAIITCSDLLGRDFLFNQILDNSK